MLLNRLHQPVSHALAPVAMVDDQRQQPGEPAGPFQDRKDVHGGDRDQLTVVIGAEQRARRIVEPVVETFMDGREICRIAELVEKSNEAPRVIAPD